MMPRTRVATSCYFAERTGLKVELLAINEKEAPKEPTMGFTKQTEAEQKREEGKHGNIAVRQHYE